jgi:hypothetical protein
MKDSRLIGTWRSDGRKTANEIAVRCDIPASKKLKLRRFFGRLELRYTESRCYSPLFLSGLCFSFCRDFAFICGVVLGAVNDLLRPSAVPFLTFNNAPSAGYRETQTDLLATDSRLESVTPDRHNRQKSIQMDGKRVNQACGGLRVPFG